MVEHSTGGSTSNDGGHVKALARWLQVLTTLIAGGCLALFAVLEAWWPAIVAAFMFGSLSAFLIKDIQSKSRV